MDGGHRARLSGGEDVSQLRAPTRRGWVFDTESFRHFAPLLQASQDYANLSGCRFRGSSFDSYREGGEHAGGEPPRDIVLSRRAEPSAAPLSDVARPRRAGMHGYRASEPTRAPAGAAPGIATAAAPPASLRADAAASAARRSSSPRSIAKVQAAPAVHEFSRRLRREEAALVEEVEKAFRVVMVESIRNSMVTMCRALGIFPPPLLELEQEVRSDDYAYEDVSAPLPVIAQRLYNDKERRDRDAVDGEGHGSRAERRIMTAAFIVDFASEVGLPLPQLPETHEAMLADFAAQASSWTPRSRIGRQDEVCSTSLMELMPKQFCEQDRSTWSWDASALSAMTSRLLASSATSVLAQNACFRRGK